MNVILLMWAIYRLHGDLLSEGNRDLLVRTFSMLNVLFTNS